MLARFRSRAQLIWSHAGFRRYFTNISWMFAEQVLRMLAGLGVGVWVAKYLGPGQFGILSYVLACVAIATSIARFGLDSILVRDLVRDPQRRDAILGTAFWLKVASSLVSLAALLAVIRISSDDRTILIYAFIIGLGMVVQPSEVIDYYFQSRVLTRFVSICRLAQLGLSCALRLYLILSGAGLFGFVVASLFDQVALAVALYLAYRYQKIGRFFMCFDWPTARQQLRDAWPLVCSAVMIAVYMRIDQVMIRTMLGNTALGIYSAAIKLTEVWYSVAMVITTAIFPAIVSARKAGEQLYESRLQLLYGGMSWLGIAIALPISVLSGWLIRLLYGPAYAAAGNVLAISIWTIVFVNLLVSVGQFLIAENRTLFAFLRNALGMATNVGCNFVLIPRYGAVGAATSSLLGYLVSSCLSNLLVAGMRRTFVMELKALLFPLYVLRQVSGPARD
jgi:O-antigen/teichoic acid export membrane protein